MTGDALGRWSRAGSARHRTVLRTSLDRLDDRVVPAVTVTDTASAVSLVADDADNSLVVRVAGQAIEYSVNGGAFAALPNARAGTVTSFIVQGGPGNDTFDLSLVGTGLSALAALGRGIDLRGGGGNDTLLGTGLNDTLDGGAGTDALAGFGGDDTLNAIDWEPDTLDGGPGYDSARFESTDAGPVSCEAWNPLTPSPDNRRHTVKVLVLNYDPVVPSRGNRPLHQVLNWFDPRVIAAAYEEAFERTSGGYVDFEVTDWRNLNGIPVKADGFAYTADEYVRLWESTRQFHDPDTADYPRMMADQGVPALVDAGLVDEVWLFGGPYFGYWESAMIGPGAFRINGPAYPEVPSSRPFAVTGFNDERFVDVLMHGTGHRTEATMERVYGGWDLAAPRTNWDRFAANAHQSNGPAGVGSAHYPANGTAGVGGDGYDYDNPRAVPSWADDFLDYPAFSGVTRPVDRGAWGRLGGTAFYDGSDYQNDYFQWLFTRLPRAAGANPDGRQNNWWKYVYDFQNYTSTGQPLPLRVHRAVVADAAAPGGTGHTVTVAYAGAVPLDAATLGGADVVVTGPGGVPLPVTMVGVSDPTNGTYRVATYRVAAPGGTWDAADRGAYAVRLAAGEVRDALGRPLPAQLLAEFRVVAVGPRPPGLVGYRQFGTGSDRGPPPRARLVDPDGAERFSQPVFADSFRGGVRVAAADFTADGVADLAVGNGPGISSSVRVIDGATGAELHRLAPFEAAFLGGVFVAAGDVDGDGRADLVVTPDEGGGPRVRVFRGGDFGPAADFLGIDDPAFRGGARAGVGDVDGDGFADLVVSAGYGGGPRVAGYAGRALAAGLVARLFADFFAFEPQLRNGAYVAAGDVNGDGRADLIAGAGPGGGPRVLALDGADVLAGRGEGARPLANFFAGSPDSRGGVRVAVKDVDADDRADVLVGDGPGGGGRVVTHFGRSLPEEGPAFDAVPGSLTGVFVG